MSLLNAAIIGCGDMGRMHAECLQQIEQINLYALCDSDIQRARALQQKYGSPLISSHAEELICDDHVQVVYITTHTASHKSLCLLAAQSGKHLMIEKPLALTAADAWQIEQAVRASGVKAMVGMKFRFYAMAKKIRTLIPAPHMICVQVTDDPWPADFWANDPLLGGGHVISQGVHGTDLIRFLAGSDPISAYAIGANYHQPTNVVDNLHAVFRFANNTAGSLLATDFGQPPGIGKFLVQVYGKEGSVVLSDRLTHLAFHDRQAGRQFHFEGAEDGFVEENRAFAQMLLGQDTAVSTVRDGCIAQAMIDAALDSARSGSVQPIQLNSAPGEGNGA
jgi:predicted dehydrogenase